MITRILLSGALALSSYAAFAADDAATSMSLDQLKQKCAELDSNQQLKKFEIQAVCREVSYIWREGKPKQVGVEGQREVGGEVRMKNYGVPFSSEQRSVQATTVKCPTLEQWKVTVPAVDVQIASCDELEQITSLAEFCDPIIAQRIEDNPDIQQYEKTDKRITTCSDLSSM